MTTLFPVTRMLDSVFNATPETWNEENQIARFVPRADVLEGEKEFRLVMDLPGVSAADLEVNLEGQELTVKASKDTTVPEGFQLRRNERAHRVQFVRTFTVGSSVDAERISAKLDNGVLNIALPKSEVSLPRRIEVK